MRKRLLIIGAMVLVALFGVIGAAYAQGDGHGGKPFDIALTPVAGSSGSGTAHLTLNSGQGEVCWDITVSNLTSPVILDHIHAGAVGVNGPIVVDFNFPANGLSGCVDGVDRALVKDIRSNPENYYVNVHTTMFPVGEVRGQLG
jgi:hypothetical protein